MAKAINYNYTVETKESGQRRAYGDSYYHYLITDNNHDNSGSKLKKEFAFRNAKGFCTKFLNKAIPQSDRKKHIEEKGFDGNFTSYYTKFECISEGVYEYKVVKPSTH